MSKGSLSEKPINKTELVKNINLSRQELLEVSQNISLYYAPKVSLSAQKLVLLAVDPKHLYAYWNLIEHQPDTVSRYLKNSEWVLKVYNQQQKGCEGSNEKPVAEIKINEFQSAQKITVPAVEKEMVYSASIGRTIEKKGFVSLINSNKTRPSYGKAILSEEDETTSTEDQIETSREETIHELLFPKIVRHERKSTSGIGKIKAL